MPNSLREGQILLAIGPQDHENVAVCEALEKLGYKVVIMQDTTCLDGIITLPFIETNEGNRHFGLLSIGMFIGRMEEQRSHARGW